MRAPRRAYTAPMGLRLLAILLLLHAAIAPAMAAARVDRLDAAPASGCCAEACSCVSKCPCAASDDSEAPVREPAPAAPHRGGEESLRHLTLTGARVIDCLPSAARTPSRILMDRSRSLPPAAFQGATAQASLCVRTT